MAEATATVRSAVDVLRRPSARWAGLEEAGRNKLPPTDFALKAAQSRIIAESCRESQRRKARRLCHLGHDKAMRDLPQDQTTWDSEGRWILRHNPACTLPLLPISRKPFASRRRVSRSRRSLHRIEKEGDLIMYCSWLQVHAVEARVESLKFIVEPLRRLGSCANASHADL